jgi:hypothetical protein
MYKTSMGRSVADTASGVFTAWLAVPGVAQTSSAPAAKNAKTREEMAAVHGVSFHEPAFSRRCYKSARISPPDISQQLRKVEKQFSG